VQDFHGGTGPGIVDSQLERVFEPFVRLENSRSKDTGGIGMGLAIARSIVKAHGGEIRLLNRSKGGLRAEIHLPSI
jgi:signal transduction histidine kinase